MAPYPFRDLLLFVRLVSRGFGANGPFVQATLRWFEPANRTLETVVQESWQVRVAVVGRPCGGPANSAATPGRGRFGPAGPRHLGERARGVRLSSGPAASGSRASPSVRTNRPNELIRSVRVRRSGRPGGRRCGSDHRAGRCGPRAPERGRVRRGERRVSAVWPCERHVPGPGGMGATRRQCRPQRHSATPGSALSPRFRGGARRRARDGCGPARSVWAARSPGQD